MFQSSRIPKAWKSGKLLQKAGLLSFFLLFLISQRTLASASDFYISTSGNDGNACTQTAPCATFNHVDGIVHPGDTVHVLAGTYTLNSSTCITTATSGTSSAPITWQSDVHGAAKINGNGACLYAWHVTGNYQRIFGFDFTGIQNATASAMILDEGGGGNVEVAYSTFHDLPTPFGAAVIMEPFSGGYTGAPCTVHDNVFFNIAVGQSGSENGYSIYNTCGTNTTIYNNLIYNEGSIGIQCWHSATQVHIYNNTVDHAAWGILVGSGDAGAVANAYYDVTNNIVTNSTYGIAAEDQSPFNSGNAATISPSSIFRNNLVFNNVNDWYYNNAGTIRSITTSFTVSGTVSGKDPLFVAPSSGNYQLQSGSPAIGAGLETSYTPALDLAGATRPNPPSIGAYDSSGGGGGGGSGVTITIPGSVSPPIQMTNPVPLRALVNSGNSFNIKTVQVKDGSTQVANYAGNGTPQVDVRGEFTLSTGTHTLTVTGTDTNNGTVSGSTTFVVASNGSVTQSPVADSQGPSPVSWQATCTANSGQVITAMAVYLDNPSNGQPLIPAFTGLNQNTVTESASFNSTQIPNGSHSLTTNCWDGNQQVYQSSVDFTVGAAFPAAPGNAVSLNLDNPSAGWTACAGCSGDPGGDAQNSDSYPALPPTYPTIDNDSRNFSITTSDGSTFQGFLWYTGLTNSGSQFTNGFPENWIFDYYVNVSNPLSPDYKLQLDANQTPGAPSGDGYVLGTECNYGANPLSGAPTIWRFFDVSNWNETYNTGGALSCPLTSAGHWYHVQMYFTINTSTNQYTVQNVRVTDTTLDIVVQDSSTPFSFGVTSTTGHGNSLQAQQHGNSNQSFSATYDKLNIIRW